MEGRPRPLVVPAIEFGDPWPVAHLVSLDELERTIQRERPDLSASLAVDGTVTIVSTGIIDSTPMLARLGDRAWREVIRRHNRLIEAVTAAHGGTVAETQGDGSMLAFSSARGGGRRRAGDPARDRAGVRRPRRR